MIRELDQYIGQQLSPTFADGDQEVSIDIPFAGGYAEGSQDVIAAMARGLPVTIGGITEGLSAAEQGLQGGDTVISVDGVAVTSSGHLLALVRSGVAEERPVSVVVQRPVAEPGFVGQLVNIQQAVLARARGERTGDLAQTAVGRDRLALDRASHAGGASSARWNRSNADRYSDRSAACWPAGCVAAARNR